ADLPTGPHGDAMPASVDSDHSGVLLQALQAGAGRGDEGPRASADALERARREVLDNAFLSDAQKTQRLMPIAEGFMCLQDWPRSTRTFEELLALERRRPEPDPHTMARALTGLARVTSVVAQSIEGSRVLLVEAAQWTRRDTVTDLQRVALWTAQADLMEFATDLVRADALLEEAIRVLEGQPSSDPQHLLQLQNRRARVLIARGDLRAADALVVRLRQQASEWLRHDDPRLAPLLTTHGQLLEAHLQYERAVDLYALAVERLEPHYADTDGRLIHARLALAQALSRAGDSVAAVALYRRIINHVESKDARNVVGLSGLHVDLSNALLAARQPQRAYQHIRRALVSIEGRTDAPDWLRYSANSVYGAVLIELGRCTEGLQRLEETLDDLLLHGVDDPRITDDIHARRARYEGSRCATRDRRA
ncbi:MAG: hypothetical protein AAFX85_07585, partial [Pseudomonadota bacterium]